MMNKSYYIFKTEHGWIGIAGSNEGICRTTFPEKSYTHAFHALDLDENFQKRSSDRFTDLIISFENYYRGLPVEFKIKLDLCGLTDFQKSVYQITKTIPYGETRSYGWIAERIGNPKASRAVGQALGRNPMPIVIPCHRVLTTRGGLGGFRGGLALKKYLLKLEVKINKPHP